MLKADNSVSLGQYYFVISLVWILIFILIARYFQIQVISFDAYSKKSNTNRIRKITTNAPRGLILDRNGEILVDNNPTYVLSAIPGELSQKGEKFGLISNIIGLDSNRVSKNFKKYYRGKFTPTRLAKDLTFEQISKLEENKYNLKGIYYQQFPERYFPSKIRASHVLGYVKEVDRTIRNNLSNKDNYELGDMVGWNGLEKKYEKYLRGIRGVHFYQFDAFGRETGKVIELKPQQASPGQNIITTIDINIQSEIEKLMRNKKGVIIVGAPISGEILGAVSAPDFRPNLFTGRMSEEEWNNVLYHPDKPLINRLNQGLYPPGSIVKMITQSRLLENPSFDPEQLHKCEGSYQFGDRLFRCWWEKGHGNINLSSALINSCDIYFYKTIGYYDLDLLAKSFNMFGFGKISGLDILNESKGIVPSSKFMNERYGSFGWSKGAILNICIGQGEILVTPIQVFNFINLLATKGLAKVPHFVMVDYLPNNVSPILSLDIWSRISDDMENVLVHENGTGKSAYPNIQGIKVFGKTGTAENPHGKDHAWFIGWIEFENQMYSTVVLLENSGSGGSKAAPVAKEVFQSIYNNLIAAG
jgi:penicillin-binding protein 2